MITVKEFARLKTQVEEANKTAERSVGALEEIRKQLKEDFDCTSLSHAKAMLSNLTQKIIDSETAFQEALSEFQEKWPNDDA